jgi:hypothetical protein
MGLKALELGLVATANAAAKLRLGPGIPTAGSPLLWQDDWPDGGQIWPVIATSARVPWRTVWCTVTDPWRRKCSAFSCTVAWMHGL